MNRRVGLWRAARAGGTGSPWEVDGDGLREQGGRRGRGGCYQREEAKHGSRVRVSLTRLDQQQQFLKSRAAAAERWGPRGDLVSRGLLPVPWIDFGMFGCCRWPGRGQSMLKNARRAAQYALDRCNKT